jgi:hypothetical protein
MKNIFKRITVISLVAAMGMSLAACGRSSTGDDSTAENNTSKSVDADDISIESLNSEEIAQVLKQKLTVVLEDEDGNELVQDATEAAEGSDGNSAVEYETYFETVTDANGEAVTNEAGEAETQVVVVNNNSGTGSNDGTSSNGSGSDATGSNGSGSDNSNYTSKIVTARTYWLDMQEEKDYVFNGEFLIATFKIKDTTPDGNYPVSISKADVANYDAETLKSDVINGYVTVGNAETPDVDTPVDGNFTFTVDSVKANAGDTVDVVFNIKDNPGLCAFVFCFDFDSNALEYEGLSVGADAEDIVEIE